MSCGVLSSGLAGLGGCGGGSGRAPAVVGGGGVAVMPPAGTGPGGAEVPASNSDVVWARPGETIVVRVRPSDAVIRAGLVSLRFGTSSTMATLYRIEPERVERVYSEVGRQAGGCSQAWMTGGSGETVDWRARRAGEGAGAKGAGFWVMAIDPPLEERPQRIVLDGRTVLMGWITGLGDASTPWTDAPEDADEWLNASLAVARRAPTARWRARLTAGEPLLKSPESADAFGDRVLEGLARQEEYHWQAALERVKAIDPALARRLARRLGSATEIGGRVVPAWGGDGAEVITLRDRILDARVGDPSIGTAARAWLDSQPIGGAIVMDDAGSGAHAEERARPMVLAVNFGDEAIPVWVARAGAPAGEAGAKRVDGGRSAFVVAGGTLGASESVRVDVKPGRRTEDRGASAAGILLKVSIGAAAFERTALAGAIGAAPPGVTIGPMLADWTMPMFMASATEATTRAPLPQAEGARSVAGRIYREPGAGAARWTVYVECLRDASLAGDELLLHFGPADAPLSVLRVRPDGAMSELRAGGGGAPAGSARVATLDDGWAAWIPVPAAAVESGRYVRLGVVRETGAGWRAAWPRPMLPWQTQPARVLIDLSEWSPVGD